MFEGVRTDVYKYLSNDEVKFDLDSIKESFCYLFVGHWMQGALGHDRKNVGEMVKFFFESFKNKITIIDNHNSINFDLKSKKLVAKDIVNHIIKTK